MLTSQDKLLIYDLLTKKFEKNTSFPLSVVSKELTVHGCGCRKFGFSHMKDLVKEMPEFIEVEEYEYEGHSNCNVVLTEWNERKAKPKEASKVAESDTASMARSYPKSLQRPAHTIAFITSHSEEDPGEEGGFVSGRGLSHYTQRTAEMDSRRVLPFTDSVKKEVASLLLEKFKTGRELHMATISKFLMENGYQPRKYGYTKMKSMLLDMPEYMDLKDVIINQVPNVLITLKNSDVSTSETESADQSSQQDFVERRWADIRTDQSRSSGSVRFTTNKEEGRSSFTFKESSARSIREIEPEKEKTQFQRMVYLSPKLEAYLRNKGLEDPMKTLEESYHESIKNNKYPQRQDTISFPVLQTGEEGMVAFLKKNTRPVGKPWYLGYVDYPQKAKEAEEMEEKDEKDEDGGSVIAPGKELEKFGYIRYWQEFLGDLADLALPEEWDDHSRKFGRNYILKKYIQYTFYRLKQEDKICISSDHKFAAFNTGLVNNHYDDIFACFVPNPEHQTDSENSPEWRFETFAIAGVRGKDGVGKLISSYFDPLPQAPSYVENKEDLFYDLNCDLVTDYEHIIVENIDRLPKGYLRECCYGDERAQELIDQFEASQGLTPDRRRIARIQISQYIQENDKIYRRLRSRMEDAIEIALKRIRWNFRLAVPCYFPRGNSMSLMLPLCLEDDQHTDAALIVKKNPSGSYQGQTVLLLEQAYLDARLVCNPSTDWVRPAKKPFEQRYTYGNRNGFSKRPDFS